MELLDRKKMHTNAMLLSIGEDVVRVPLNLQLIFLSKMGEPIVKDPLAHHFGVINFKLYRIGDQHEYLEDLVIKKHNPSLHSEWQSMLNDRASLCEEWRKTDIELAEALLPHWVNGAPTREFFQSEPIVANFVSIKNELMKTEKKLLKNK